MGVLEWQRLTHDGSSSLSRAFYNVKNPSSMKAETHDRMFRYGPISTSLVVLFIMRPCQVSLNSLGLQTLEYLENWLSSESDRMLLKVPSCPGMVTNLHRLEPQ